MIRFIHYKTAVRYLFYLIFMILLGIYGTDVYYERFCQPDMKRTSRNFVNKHGAFHEFPGISVPRSSSINQLMLSIYGNFVK